MIEVGIGETLVIVEDTGEEETSTVIEDPGRIGPEVASTAEKKDILPRSALSVSFS